MFNAHSFDNTNVSTFTYKIYINNTASELISD